MDRRQKIHWNKTETETDPQFYYHFIFDKDIKATQWGKGLQQVAGCNKKKYSNPTSHHTQKLINMYHT